MNDIKTLNINNCSACGANHAGQVILKFEEGWRFFCHNGQKFVYVAERKKESSPQEHCPVCHSWWFRTVSDLTAPSSQWIRECKGCGHQYPNRDAALLVSAPADRAKFPHCDPRILHANGECEHCDKYSDWQELRKSWQIAFTGHKTVDAPGVRRDNDDRTVKYDAVLPCPADYIRGDAHTRWGGNRATTDVNIEKNLAALGLPSRLSSAVTGICDRCNKQVPNFGPPAGGITAGYYLIDESWQPYANEGETIICDFCMWSDPRYIKDFGRINLPDITAG